MTATPLNTSTVQPGAAGAAGGLFGAGAAAAAQGPLAGFDALLAAFFGNQGAGEPAVGADGKPIAKLAGAAKDAKTAGKGEDSAETTDTALPSTDAQILAALLAQPIARPVAAEATQAEAPADGQAATKTAATAAFVPATADTTIPTDALQTVKTAAALAVGEIADPAGQAAGQALAGPLDPEAAAEPASATVPVSALLTPADGKPAAARPAANPASPAPEASAPRATAPPAAATAAAVAPPSAPPAPVAEAAEAVVAAEAAPIADAAETAATETEASLTAPIAAPRAKTTARTARNEAGPQAATSSAIPAAASADPLTAAAVAPTEGAANFDSGSKSPEGKREDAAPAVEAKADVDTGQPVAPQVADTAATAATSAPAEMRAGPQTVAHLAAQIVRKLEGRSTQFDVALNPEGLGRVDVRIEIGAQGKLTASMAFENPQAAAELRTRAGELQKALEQAGFDISGGIRFDVAADRGQGQTGQGQFGQDFQNNGGASRGRAFQAALDSAGETADAALSGALNLQRRTLMSGVDVRI